MKHKKGFYEKYIKRPQDFLCALLALIVLSPIMLVTAYLVRTRLGSPVLFTQNRPGLHGKVFKLYKFRSMTDAKDEKGIDYIQYAFVLWFSTGEPNMLDTPAHKPTSLLSVQN